MLQESASPTTYAPDRLVLVPDDIDLSRSPLAGSIRAPTFVLGAFNPGLTRLPNGNLLMMVRVAEALSEPIVDGRVHAIRWHEGRYVRDAWPVKSADCSDPRKFTLLDQNWTVMALTSISWLLPVEMTPDGLEIVAIHYDRAIAPSESYQCYGVEDARISIVEGRYYMTTCSVSPERHSTTLYTSSDGLDWHLEGIVLDHQNKDMLIFEGLIDGQFWAQTRPLGDVWFAYPPDSEWLAGPSINLATSPDALHWRPHPRPGLRAKVGSQVSGRVGGGTPPIMTDDGWLFLWHGVEPIGVVGIYRTYWGLLDPRRPDHVILRSDPVPLLVADPALTEPIRHQMYLGDVVFTTGIADAGDYYVVASGEADLACRITHIPKSAFRL
jgi:predicted GH43/DUF377 family glycosyl hydrolase